MKPAALGELSTGEFLRRHWQKKPLLVRAALPRFEGILDPREPMALAAETPDLLYRRYRDGYICPDR